MNADRKIAQQHKTGVVVIRDGEVVEIEPEPKMYENYASSDHQQYGEV